MGTHVSRIGTYVKLGHFVELDRDFVRLGCDSVFCEKSHLGGVWARIIDQYSGRQLSVFGDKLPAVSSLAIRLSEVGEGVLGRYYAGLWEASLLQSPLWTATPHGRRRFPAFVAPS
jgi:hypothetical protein